MIKKTINVIPKTCGLLKTIVMDKRPKVAYVGGWLGKRNLGDEALFDAYQFLFPKFGLVAFDGGRLSAQFAQQIKLFKSGLLGGGTLINALGCLEKANKFFEICPNLYVFGTGVEHPVFGPPATIIRGWSTILKKCRFIGVRGPLSAELLHSHGFKQIEIVGDPVVALADKAVNQTPVPDTIGINIGTSDGRLWGSEERVCNETAKIARIAKLSGWSVEWFVVWPKDLPITRKAAMMSETIEKIHVIYDDYRKFMDRVRHLSTFVGMKLHSTVLATCALTPSVMLEYRPKCMDYMRSIGQEKATFRTDSFKAEEIWEIVRFWNSNHYESSKNLAKCVHALQDKQRSLAIHISNQLPTAH